MELPLLEEVEMQQKELPRVEEVKLPQLELRRLDEVETTEVEVETEVELEEMELPHTEELLVVLVAEAHVLFASHQSNCPVPSPAPKAWAQC